MRPLDRLGSIKVKFGVVILAAMSITLLLNEIGLRLNISPVPRWALAGVLCVLMVQVLARGMTSPLREMAAAARAMARGDYGRAVHVSARDEVAELARAFTHMSGELAAVDAERRRLIADVSHELRTPLAALRAMLENLADGVTPADPAAFETALAQTERLGRLVEQLLDLSRLESGSVPLERRRVPLRLLLEQAAREQVAPGLTLQVDAADGLTGDVDPERLHQALANLLQNAVRHSPAGGTVRLAAVGRCDAVELSVSDDGPGIPTADRDRVFERFARLDDARGGSGLGLSIARWVVELHGGSIHIEAGSTTGPPGCRVVVELPDRAPVPT